MGEYVLELLLNAGHEVDGVLYEYSEKKVGKSHQNGSCDDHMRGCRGYATNKSLTGSGGMTCPGVTV